jgi:hypothetical protein
MDLDKLVVDLSRYPQWHWGPGFDKELVPPVLMLDSDHVKLVYPPQTTLAGHKLRIVDVFEKDRPAEFMMVVRHDGQLWAIFSGIVAAEGRRSGARLARPVTAEEARTLRDMVNELISPLAVAARRDELIRESKHVWFQMCSVLASRIPESFRLYAWVMNWVDGEGRIQELPKFIEELVRSQGSGLHHARAIAMRELEQSPGMSRDGLMSAAEELREAWAGVIEVTTIEYPGNKTISGLITIHFKLPDSTAPVT